MRRLPTTITGYAATYGRRPNAEFYFEGGPFEIVPGAFDGWVERIRPDGLPMCRNHDLDWIVGRWTGFETDDIGLIVSGQFNLETVEGKKACQMVEDGEAGGLSLGGDMAAMQKPIICGMVPYIRDVLDVAEISIVTVPGNPSALIHSFCSSD